jgi:tartrate-resistant acid phosphatase type 5
MKSSFALHPFLICLTIATFLSGVEAFSQQQAEARPGSVDFLVIGDGGTGGGGARRVGRAMTDVYKRYGATAVLSTGDNIYPSGVSDVDDPQWLSKFENIYPAAALPIPFWAVLGNHDYRKNPDAQVEYTGHRLADGSITRWNMPGRGWTTVFTSPDESVTVRVLGVDTQQLITSKRRKEHLAWIDSVLAASKEHWTFVMGHHPVYSHGHYGDNAAMKRHLAPLLERHGVHAYLNGHEHDLQVIQKVNGVRYLVSGAGGGVRKSTPGKRSDFSAGVLGFMRLSCDKDGMLIEVYDASAEKLYSTRDEYR